MTYRAPFVNLPRHWASLSDELMPVIEDVLSRGQVIMREELAQFEEELASFCGVGYAVGLNSCTDGMILALRSAGIGAGDEVLTVGHTFVATLAAIVHNGAKPILVDVKLDDYLMDMDAAEQAITPRTRAIIPVHLNGRMCDMDRLTLLADKHGLVVIEDAAQALGATFEGRPAGSFGLAGCFSLYPMKMMGVFGDGGVLVTGDEKLNKSVRILRDHGQDRATGEVVAYGFNSRLDNLQAAIASVKLRRLPSWIEHRRRLAARYDEGFADISEVQTPPSSEGAEKRFDVYQNYVIRADQRDLLVKHLDAGGVEVLVSWPNPIHHHQRLGLSGFHLPNTEEISDTVVSLPMNPEVTDAEADHTIERVRSFYR